MSLSFAAFGIGLRELMLEVNALNVIHWTKYRKVCQVNSIGATSYAKLFSLGQNYLVHCVLKDIEANYFKSNDLRKDQGLYFQIKKPRSYQGEIRSCIRLNWILDYLKFPSP